MAAKTPKHFEAVLEALRSGNTRRAACHVAGINSTTLYEWLKKPTLSNAIKKAEADAETEMVKIVRTAAKKTWTAAAWWLERKQPKDWGRKDKLTNEVSGRNGGPIQTQQVFSHDAAIAAIASRSGAYRDKFGTDQDGSDGEAVG